VKQEVYCLNVRQEKERETQAWWSEEDLKSIEAIPDVESRSALPHSLKARI